LRKSSRDWTSLRVGTERSELWRAGEKSAAIVIAAILQRGAAITSAGGYLPELTRKAQVNEFSIGPMLMALIGVEGAGSGEKTLPR